MPYSLTASLKTTENGETARVFGKAFEFPELHEKISKVKSAAVNALNYFRKLVNAPQYLATERTPPRGPGLGGGMAAGNEGRRHGAYLRVAPLGNRWRGAGGTREVETRLWSGGSEDKVSKSESREPQILHPGGKRLYL